jgi:hypothetical protein
VLAAVGLSARTPSSVDEAIAVDQR